MEILTYSCDTCTTQKKDESTVWYKAYKVDDNGNKTCGVMIIPLDKQSFNSPFKSFPLPKPDAHLCSVNCALQWSGKVLAGGTS